MTFLYLLHNGNLHPSNALFISPNNRSFRYGDGFFETMKMINGSIVLEELHFERLFRSLQVMQFDKPDYFTPEYIHQQIQALTIHNKQQPLARVRLMIFRGDGGLYDVENNEPNCIIQGWALNEFPVYNNEGLSIAIYTDARKTADTFSMIKSNNYMPYTMTARWCNKMSLDDALVINCYGRIAEATTSNMFIVKDNIVQTPPLSEGCISGVVRRYLLQYIEEQNIRYEEKALTPEEVLEADELFLTNAGFYIRWVKQCGAKIFGNSFSKQLFHEAIVPLVNSAGK